jgi:hypothetical protein
VLVLCFRQFFLDVAAQEVDLARNRQWLVGSVACKSSEFGQCVPALRPNRSWGADLLLQFPRPRYLCARGTLLLRVRCGCRVPGPGHKKFAQSTKDMDSFSVRILARTRSIWYCSLCSSSYKNASMLYTQTSTVCCFSHPHRVT